MTKTKASVSWDQPQVISDVDYAFPASVSHLMPAYEMLPRNISPKWRAFQSDWFFKGILSPGGMVPKSGIDKRAALRHLGAIQGSFEPKHEHKCAAVAYLASLWFDDSSTW